MYAVIRTGGKQHRVQQGQVIRVELLGAQAGETVTFDEVLAVGDGAGLRVGSPTVAGASVRASVVRNARHKKILIYVFKHRQNSNRRRSGHRQHFSEVRIDAIEA